MPSSPQAVRRSRLFIALESKRAELFLARRDRADPRLPALVPAEEWAAILPPGPCCLAGDGAARLAAALGRRDLTVLPGHGRPDPVELARLGAQRWQAGDRTTLMPLYLRAPDTTTPRQTVPVSSVTLVLVAAREADLSRVAKLHAECFPDEAWNSSALATVLAMPGADGRICYGEDGTPCGLLFDQCLGPEGEILTLGVAPAWRRRGVARMLLQDLVLRARAGGAQRLLLEVAADNTAALALYESFGFARQGIRRNYYRRNGGPGGRCVAVMLAVAVSGLTLN